MTEAYFCSDVFVSKIYAARICDLEIYNGNLTVVAVVVYRCDLRCYTGENGRGNSKGAQVLDVPPR